MGVYTCVAGTARRFGSGCCAARPKANRKTTLLEQIIDHLLNNNVSPRQIFRVQFDDLPELGKVRDVSVILELCRWFSENILHKSFNQAATDGEQPFIFLDEVQNLPDWAPQLKHLVDMHPVRVLVTCSSALRIEAGRDRLSGRTCASLGKSIPYSERRLFLHSLNGEDTRSHRPMPMCLGKGSQTS